MRKPGDLQTIAALAILLASYCGSSSCSKDTSGGSAGGQPPATATEEATAGEDEDYSRGGASHAPAPIKRWMTFSMADRRKGMSFIVAATEVTNSDWEAVRGDQAAQSDAVRLGCGSCPVEAVTVAAMVEFLNALSARDGLTPCFEVSRERTMREESKTPEIAAVNFLHCTGYRVPTLEEWLMVAEGNITEFFGHWGEGNPVTLSIAASKLGWVSANSQNRSSPVGSLPANESGLFDLYGNVMELVLDSDAGGKLDPSLAKFVGCSYNSDPKFCDPANPVTMKLLDARLPPGLGFRLARTVDSENPLLLESSGADPGRRP